MSKIAVIYWSGTGNTEAMAEAVAEGARAAGGDVSLVTATDFDPASVDSYDGFAFGCPAMGAESLEEDEFEPMFTASEGKLTGKPVGLFGSYGWGDGEWMRTWMERCAANQISLVQDGVICNDAPDHDDVENCRQLGRKLVE